MEVSGEEGAFRFCEEDGGQKLCKAIETYRVIASHQDRIGGE